MVAAISATIVEKRNALAYVETVLDLHRRDGVVLPLDTITGSAPSGVRIVDRVPVEGGAGGFHGLSRRAMTMPPHRLA